MRVLIILCLSLLVLSNAGAQPKNKTARHATGFVQLIFNNRINGQPVLPDSNYTNPFGEQYRIRKLKYYVSNIQLEDALVKKTRVEKAAWLVNQAIDSSCSITIAVNAGRYRSVGFLLGVDSVMNSSGAHTGALDPLNDMFWTWRSGYIMEKLEGYSPQSNVVNNKFEYHIGGYEGENSVLKNFSFDQNILVKKGDTTVVRINADIEKFWDAVTPLRISETPVCSVPGALAKKIAENFYRIFSIDNSGN